MSASLVGSEMCIRDRSRAGQSAEGWWPLVLTGRPAAACEAAPRPSWTGPVSYTHLTLPTICSV
eukprot:14442542-Alexandrium_andersonii.AAC.1